jgi:hypothetical protein
MRLIALKLKDHVVDLTTKDGFQWLRDNLLSDSIEFYNAKKDYTEDKYLDIFKIVESGGSITKGELFQYFETLVKG